MPFMLRIISQCAFGEGRPWADGVGRNAISAHFQRDAFRQHPNARFGDPVPSQVHVCLDASHRSQQNDASGDVHLDHDPGCGLRGEETSPQIHARQAIKRFRRVGQEGAVIRDASISNGDIQSSRCVNEALTHGPDGFHIGDVTCIRVDPRNAQGSIDLLGGLLAECRIDIVQCHRGSGTGEGLAERIANPCSGPGDENRFSSKGAHAFPPQSESPKEGANISVPHRFLSLWPPLRPPLWHMLRSTPASSRPSWQVGERQVHAQQNNRYDDDQANECVEISCDLYANQDTYQKADDSKDNLTLCHRNSPLLIHLADSHPLSSFLRRGEEDVILSAPSHTWRMGSFIVLSAFFSSAYQSCTSAVNCPR